MIKTKSIEITDHGDEIAFPYIEINSKGGDITLNIGSNSLTILRTQSGIVTIDTEKESNTRRKSTIYTRQLDKNESRSK